MSATMLEGWKLMNRHPKLNITGSLLDVAVSRRDHIRDVLIMRSVTAGDEDGCPRNHSFGNDCI
ncbi:MAG: hypothetical protein JO188_20770 [Hyphomicrobiales bacterium]|nr:hypothetical protein [Hyphomicrobiales bacterium]